MFMMIIGFVLVSCDLWFSTSEGEIVNGSRPEGIAFVVGWWVFPRSVKIEEGENPKMHAFRERFVEEGCDLRTPSETTYVPLG